jgi:amicyanin
MQRQFRSFRPFTLALTLALLLGGLVVFRPESSTAAQAQAAAATVTVDIRNFAYAPTPLVVPVGTTVTWTNYDAVGHDVTGSGEFAPVKSPLLGRNQSWSYTFTKPGTYRYYCSPHPFMQAEVQVTDESGPAETVTFPETGKTVQGRFLTYWRGNGLDFGDAGVSYRESLALFGLPISDEIQEKIGEGTYTVQYFERARFEYHPEISDQRYQVLLGQFGRQIHPADPPVAQKPGATFFPDTGHNVEGRFLEYWTANGGLAIFGLPLSEPIQERLGDGQTYTVQYFERARFEQHPGNQPPYDVLLGQFGRQIYEQQGGR